MNYKWIGAILVISGCGSCGFAIASQYRFEVQILLRLRRLIEYMGNELQYSLTPLPELCRRASRETSGVLNRLFLDLCRELDWQLSPDVNSCMRAAVRRNPELPRSAQHILLQMGRTLGSFDLPGQIKELESLRASCERELNRLESNKDTRLRNYQTLSLCTGAALAILFI